MDPGKLKERIPISELRFTTSRSGGPGGQNVNKVNTKVELRFNVTGSSTLTSDEIEKILRRLKNKINADGDLIIVSQSERTQLMNRKKAVEKFFMIVAGSLTESAKRNKTTRTKASIRKRLEKKKKQSNIKKLRRGTGLVSEECSD